MTQALEKFSCFFRQYSTPYIDFDLYLQREEPKAEGEEFQFTFFIDTSENNELVMGDIRYAANKNDDYDDVCPSDEDIDYFRSIMVTEESALLLSHRIGEILKEEAPEKCVPVPSAQEILEFLGGRMFRHSNVPKI